MQDETTLVCVPEENLTVSFEVTEVKPFNQCFKCRSFRNGCSGPNLLAMGVERLSEMFQMARIHLGYSYQYVADSTGISIATVKRFFAGKITDPSFFTLKALSDLLLGDPNGKFPCANPDIVYDAENVQKLNDALRDLERALDDNKDYRKMLDDIHDSYNAEMQTIRDEAKMKIDYLLAELERSRTENSNLWAENIRKSKLVDMLIEKQNVLLTEKA